MAPEIENTTNPNAAKPGGVRIGAGGVDLAPQAHMAQEDICQQRHAKGDDYNPREADGRGLGHADQRFRNVIRVDLTAAGQNEDQAAIEAERAQGNDDRRQPKRGNDHLAEHHADGYGRKTEDGAYREINVTRDDDHHLAHRSDKDKRNRQQDAVEPFDRKEQRFDGADEGEQDHQHDHQASLARPCQMDQPAHAAVRGTAACMIFF